VEVLAVDLEILEAHVVGRAVDPAGGELLVGAAPVKSRSDMSAPRDRGIRSTGRERDLDLLLLIAVRRTEVRGRADVRDRWGPRHTEELHHFARRRLRVVAGDRL